MRNILITALRYYICVTFSFSTLILLEVPGLIVFGQHQLVFVERSNFHANIVEGPEAEVVLHDGSIRCCFPDGVALDEQTVTLVLEVAVNLSLGKVRERDVSKQCHAARETQIVCVRSLQTPLSQQVASLTPFLAGNEQHDSA